MTFWTMVGEVTSLAEKTAGWGANATLVGVRVQIRAMAESDPDRRADVYTGSIDVPLGWVPPELRVGALVRLTAELGGEDASESDASEEGGR